MSVRAAYFTLGILLAVVAMVSFLVAAVIGESPRFILTVVGLVVVALAGVSLAVGIKAGAEE